MDEYADIYYVDENRNAVTVTDHRTGSSSAPRPGWPFNRPAAPSQPVRTVYVAPPARPIYTQPQLAQPQFVAQPQIMYAPPQTTAAALFGKLTTGQIVEMVAQIFAALQSLPAAPVATRDASTDVANLILFNKALADHAKRDEEVRTLGSLVAKLVG